ncbi:MAG: hypothetical protein ABEJ81_08140 [Haloferacaceae archaeon]
MVKDVFEEPDDPREEWVDVRMTDPEAGEWDVDVVVVDGHVEYVDLRVKPDLLAEFVDCLIDDVGPDRADEILANVADRQDVDLDGGAIEE